MTPSLKYAAVVANDFDLCAAVITLQFIRVKGRMLPVMIRPIVFTNWLTLLVDKESPSLTIYGERPTTEHY